MDADDIKIITEGGITKRVFINGVEVKNVRDIRVNGLAVKGMAEVDFSILNPRIVIEDSGHNRGQDEASKG